VPVPLDEDDDPVADDEVEPVEPVADWPEVAELLVSAATFVAAVGPVGAPRPDEFDDVLRAASIESTLNGALAIISCASAFVSCGL
jgi:hypothetical protein